MDLFAAKSQDKTTGLGPWIVTRDEFPEGMPALRLTLSVNGEVRQDGNTSEMTWTVAELITFVHERSSFACGDVLFTGSPAGVGMATVKLKSLSWVQVLWEPVLRMLLQSQGFKPYL